MTAETLTNYGHLIEGDDNKDLRASSEGPDDTPAWVRTELEERMRRLDSGEEKVLSLEEAWKQLEAYKSDFRNRKP